MLDVDIHTPITDERRDEVIDSIAEKIVRRRLEMPAVLFLEMHKPLSFIASQSMMVAMPLLGMIFGAQPMADLSKILAERENVDRLIMRIEEVSATRSGIAGHAELDSASCTDPESSSG